MPSGELNKEKKQIRSHQKAGVEQGSWGEPPGENGHKCMGRDLLFSACRSGLRNASVSWFRQG